MDGAIFVETKSATLADISADDLASVTSGNVENALIDSIWYELDGHIDREFIVQAVQEANAIYQNATIKTFLPILIRRYVLEKIK